MVVGLYHIQYNSSSNLETLMFQHQTNYPPKAGYALSVRKIVVLFPTKLLTFSLFVLI